MELPPWLKVLYPFEARTHACPDGRLHYVDEGRGSAVVMFHGNPTWSFFYRDLILELRPSNRCLALDHLGCGLSDKPQRADYALQAHIDRATRWLESRDAGPFHLVVHDWGGPVGLGVAAAMKGQLTRLTILNTAGFAFPAIPKRIAACRIPLAGTLMVRGANAFVEAATRMTTVNPLSEAVKAAYRLPYGSWADRVAVNAFVKDIPMRRGHRSWKTLQAVESSLPGLRDIPVQVIWGLQDWCFHTGILAEWEKRLPEAEVHRIAEAGHYLMEDAGERVIQRIGAFNRR